MRWLSLFFITAFPILIYAINFRNHPISREVGDWADFGAYVGGVVGPLLTFLTVFLLARTLISQISANKVLKKTYDQAVYDSRIQVFEARLFRSLEWQHDNFKSLCLQIRDDVCRERNAVIALMTEVDDFVGNGFSIEDAAKSIEKMDIEDSLHEAVRIFSNIVGCVAVDLSDERGFCKEDRVRYYSLILNMTSFSNIQLISVCYSFLLDNSYVCKVLANSEFSDVCRDFDLSFDLSCVL